MKTTKKWAYYNDNDPNVCAWVRELISANLITDGEVDGRSIYEVKPDDVKNFRRVHWFCGIAGWELALRLANWPQDKPVWTASCPCQPFSCSGKAGGVLDERHLWPVVQRLIAECNPPTIFGEQVASAAGRSWFAGVRDRLERMGYAVGGSDLCAAGIGAPHIRQRLYWLADSTGDGCERTRQTGEIEEGRKPRPEFAGKLPMGFERPSDSSRMDDSKRPRLEGQPRDGNHRDQSRRINPHEARPATPPSFWSDSILIPCTDGKSRRIPSPESLLRSLDHGLQLPVDVGGAIGGYPLCPPIKGLTSLLRGYGNSIVPELAAEFITAFLETITPYP